MAFDNMTLVQLIPLLIWTCLCVSPKLNPLYRQLFSTQACVVAVLQLASLSYCDDLLDVLQASCPPSLLFFKRLPNAASKRHGKRWGVYAIVLEKKGARPLIYIGSGTEDRTGVSARVSRYDGEWHDNLPRLVWKALQDGYKITHRGLIIWCPLPASGNVPVMRLLMVAMETVFSFLFWTMCSRDKDYGIGSCCPWPRSAFTYDGLCTHNALCEKVSGDFTLTAEQLEAVAALRKQQRNEHEAQKRRDGSTSDHGKDKSFGSISLRAMWTELSEPIHPPEARTNLTTQEEG